MTRLIARLDIKGNNLIKGIHFEGLRIIGDPVVYAKKYYDENIDEIIYIDTVASLYDRTYFLNLIQKTAEQVFVPITVGGGIKSLYDVEKMLHNGADKIAINTAAVKNPKIIIDIAATFGSQCMVIQIDAKKTSPGYEVYIDGGREKTGIPVMEWAHQAIALGCGEILLTSIDKDGTKKGMDIELIKLFSKLTIPVIVGGGIGTLAHIDATLAMNKIDAIAIGSAFHHHAFTPKDVKNHIRIKNE